MTLRTYKAITTYPGRLSICHEYNIYSASHFSHIKINEAYISEIIENISCSFNVSQFVLDDFLCFFFSPRIVLTEKFKEDNYVDGKDVVRSRKVWLNSKAGVDWVDNLQDGYIVFENIISNIVIMNNGSSYTVPILRR